MNPLPWLNIDPANPPTEAGEYLLWHKYLEEGVLARQPNRDGEAIDWVGAAIAYTHYLPITPPVAGQTVHEALTTTALEAIKQWAELYGEGMTVQDVVNELADYKVALEEVSKVYWHITDGKFTKLNTKAEYIIDEYDAAIARVTAIVVPMEEI